MLTADAVHRSVRLGTQPRLQRGSRRLREALREPPEEIAVKELLRPETQVKELVVLQLRAELAQSQHPCRLRRRLDLFGHVLGVELVLAVLRHGAQVDDRAGLQHGPKRAHRRVPDRVLSARRGQGRDVEADQVLQVVRRLSVEAPSRSTDRVCGVLVQVMPLLPAVDEEGPPDDASGHRKGVGARLPSCPDAPPAVRGVVELVLVHVRSPGRADAEQHHEGVGRLRRCGGERRVGHFGSRCAGRSTECSLHGGPYGVEVLRVGRLRGAHTDVSGRGVESRDVAARPGSEGLGL